VGESVAMEWGQGCYERIAEQLLPAAEAAVETAKISSGERVLDVGCGTGNAALLAAERGGIVTGIDPAQRLLEVAAATAAERGLEATFLPGEAADMPLEEDSADVVLSVFGVIFAPDPEAAAAEIDRVGAPKVRILLVAWLPGGPVSDAVRLARRTMAEILDQPPASEPFPWHQRDALSRLFEPYGFSVSLTERSISWGAPSVDEFMRIEGENHPIAISARPILEGAGRAEEVREGMRRIYEEGNEDPLAFRLTSHYVVAEMERSP
jgi:ubiquinone/menaquinone biosynthesis C-methylase UbiE